MAFQKFPTSKQLAQELNSKKPENLYLFIGEEEGEKDKIIERIINMSVPDGEEREYSVRRFHLETDELADAAEFAMSESMFSECKVCIMLNMDNIKSKTENSRIFDELLNNLPDSNIVIMTSAENKVPAIIGSKKLHNIKTYQFWRMFDNDTAGYVLNLLKKKGLDIDRQALNNLITLTGKDIKKLDDAIELLINSGEKKINQKIIEEYIQDSKDVSMFEFIDSLFRKDKSAFYQLAKVLDSGIHQLVLLKLITKQAELLEKYYYLTNSNINSEDAIQEIGINPRNIKNFINSTMVFSPASVKNLFQLIYRADQHIKSFKYSENIASDPIFELITDLFLGTSENQMR